MARVVKHPAVRKTELIDCAEELFLQRGYETTTINDIIDAAGVSKGGFYHHFTSKDDLLEAVATRASKAALEAVGDVLENPALGAIERLNGFFAAGRRMKTAQATHLQATFGAVLKPENFVLHHRIHAAMVMVIAPALARIIVQGQDEGVFRSGEPSALAEVILGLSAMSAGATARLVLAGENRPVSAWAALDTRLRFEGIIVDRILGVPDGAIAYAE